MGIFDLYNNQPGSDPQNYLPGYNQPAPQLPPAPGYQPPNTLATLAAILSNAGNQNVVGRRKGVLGALSAIGPATAATRKADQEDWARTAQMSAAQDIAARRARENETQAMLEKMAPPQGIDPDVWRAAVRSQPGIAFQWLFNERTREADRENIRNMPSPPIPADPYNEQPTGGGGGGRNGMPSAAPSAGGQRSEAPTDYNSRVAFEESGGSPTIVNAATGAAGKYQFLPSTGKYIAEKYASLGLPTDPSKWTPEQQDAAMGKFTEENRATLKVKLGREPTDADLRLAHYFGAGGATKLLAMNPNTPMEMVPNGALGASTAEVLRVNPNLRGKKVGDIIGQYQRDYAPTQQAQATAPPPTAMPTPPQQSGQTGYPLQRFSMGGFNPPAPQNVPQMPGAPGQQSAGGMSPQVAQAGGRPVMPQSGLPQDNSEVPTNPPPAAMPQGQQAPAQQEGIRSIMGVPPGTEAPANPFPPGTFTQDRKPPGWDILKSQEIAAFQRYEAARRAGNKTELDKAADAIRTAQEKLATAQMEWGKKLTERQDAWQKGQSLSPAELERLKLQREGQREQQVEAQRLALAGERQKAFDAATGKKDAEELVGYREFADLKRNYAQTASMVSELAKSGNFAGAGSGIAIGAAKILERLGGKVAGLGDAQLAEALSAEMGLDKSSLLKGSVSDFEQKKVASTIATLANTPEGIAKIAMLAQRMADRAEAVADLANNYNSIHGTDFSKKKREIISKPLFSKEEWAEVDNMIKAQGNPTANPAARQATPPAPQQGSAPAQAPKSGRYDPATGRIVYD